MSRDLKANTLDLQQRLIDLGVDDDVVIKKDGGGYNLQTELLGRKLSIEFKEMPDAKVQGKAILYVKVSFDGDKGFGFYSSSLDGIVKHIQNELDLNRPDLPDFRKMTGLDHG